METGQFIYKDCYTPIKHIPTTARITLKNNSHQDQFTILITIDKYQVKYRNEETFYSIKNISHLEKTEFGNNELINSHLLKALYEWEAKFRKLKK